MRLFIYLTFFNFLFGNVFAQNLDGAWKSVYTTGEGRTVEEITIFSEGYFGTAIYSVDDHEFIGASAGTYEVHDGQVVMTFELHTIDSSLAGKIINPLYKLEGNDLNIEGYKFDWKRIDDSNPSDLNGAWLITGRKRNGEISNRSPGARKTMKILSGTRFQWIAYNSETNDFYGTGGGTYTTVDGDYVENIDFFSRDKNRVGASLPFTYEIKDGQWHHSGLSSKGDPIYEIWTLRKEL